MRKSGRTTEQILEDVQRTLDTAELGYALFVKQTKNRLSGLMNLTVFGISVTSVLQNLRSTEIDFDQWYASYRTEIETDPLMKHFWNLRSEILKEGKVSTAPATHIKHWIMGDFSRIPPPPNNVKVRRFFLGDQLGGNGYEIELADGSVQKYYVDVPSEIGKSWLQFPDAPKTHLGKELQDTSIQMLSRLYLDYLQRIVKDAKAKFGKVT
jgi:hypothetical protein